MSWRISVAPRWVIGVVGVLVIAGTAASEFLQWRRVLEEETAVDRRWAMTLKPLADVVRPFPRSEANRSALELQGELSKIGLLRPPVFVTLEEEQGWKAR